jgi:hypothetical protein
MARKRSPYSAQVVLKLFIAGQVISLSQVGPDFVVLRDVPTQAREAGKGRVDVIVDDRVASSKEVFFPHGIVTGSKKASYF